MNQNYLKTDSEKKWFAVYTNYKREKLVQRMLDNKGITTFLPLQKLVRKYSKKTKLVELPLLSCYIFVHIDHRDYIKVLETENVLKFVKSGKDLAQIKDIEIDWLRRVVNEDVELTIVNQIFSQGDEVEIVKGNLVGLEGKLLSFDGKKYFTIEIANMGYTFCMSVDKKYLKKKGTAFSLV